MNEQIISPWLIYFIGQAIDIKVISIFIVVILVVIIGRFLIDRTEIVDDLEMYRATPNFYGDRINKSEGELKRNNKRLFLTILLCVIFLLISLLTPDEATCYKMLVADQLTYENINKLGDSAKDTVDYIFDKIEEVQNGSTYGSTDSEGK